MWAHEGKILLLIDGEEMNEDAYSTIQLGNHYPVDSIKHIEVIRGPGSATHGGYANWPSSISSPGRRRAERTRGQWYLRTDAFGLRGTRCRFGYGKRFEDWKFSTYLFAGQGNQSDRDYTDQNGATYNFAGNSNHNPLYANVGASNDRWNLQFIFDRYDNTDESGFGQNTPFPLGTNFQSMNFGVKYTAPVSEHFSLIPEIHLKQQVPWNVTDPSAYAQDLYYNVTTQEARATLSARAELLISA